MKKMNAKNLKAGKIVYYVHALGESSSVTKYIIANRPKLHIFKNISVEPSQFVPAYYVTQDGTVASYASEFSLRDGNVGTTNGYNKHRVFFKKKAADRYCALCKHHNIDLKNETFKSSCLDIVDPFDWYYDDVDGE